jgi:hypothetical protein
MEIEGTSRAGENSVPILITATSAGEVAVRTGALHDKKRVTTPTRNFREDTEKITWALAPGGFAQLDVTGLFLLAHAGQSAAKTGPATPVDQGRLKINVHRGRSEVHYGSLKVEDTFDLYLGSNGLLSDISRSFYPKSSSRHYTQLYAFADYRDTAGVLLPYRIAMYHKGKLVHTIEVNNYRFETGADPALFKTRSGL